jgi:GlpG protein
MRLVGEFKHEDQARKFSDYLTHKNIDNHLEEEGGKHEIWVVFEDDLERAENLLKKFHENKDEIDHEAVARNAKKIREKVVKEAKAGHQYVDARTTVFNRSNAIPRGRLTISLIFACIVVAVFSRLGDNLEPLRPFLFTNYYVGLPEITSGEIWRLVTPMLIHFGPLHLVFNMMWLYDLGGMLENRKGSLFMGIFVLGSSAFSNTCQYVFWGASIFGGMSGVVYGLLGYIWMRGKFDPLSGLHLPQQIVTFMILWFFLGVFQVIPHIANWAHGVGLCTGMAVGFVLAKLFPSYRLR